MSSFVFEPKVVSVPVRTWTFDPSVLGSNGEVPYALEYAFADYGYKASSRSLMDSENDYATIYELVLKPFTSNPDEEIELIHVRGGDTVAVLGYGQLHLLSYLTGETRQKL